MGTTTAKKPTVNTAGATKAVGASQTPKAFVHGVLVAIHAPVNATTTGNLYTWLANEQTTAANWASNRGNPLGIQTSTAQSYGKSGNVLGGVLETAKLLTSSYPTITSALRTSAPAAVFNRAVTGSNWNGSTHYSGSAVFAAKGAAQKANPTGWFGQWIEPILKNPVPLPGLTQLPGGATTPGGGVITNAANAIPGVGTVTSIGGLIGKITNPTNLKNVGIFVAGLALTVTGLVILFSSTKGAQTVKVLE